MRIIRRKKILEMISTGKISASEGLSLLDALDENEEEQHLKFQILSSKQENPYFNFSITMGKLPVLKDFLGKLAENDLVSKFQIGRFRIDITRLNWERILELAEIEEEEELFLMETKGQEDEQIICRISLEKR